MPGSDYRRFFFYIAAVLAIGAAGRPFETRARNLPTDDVAPFIIPKRPAPTPNAYDTFTAAATQLKKDDPDKEYELAIISPAFARKAVPPRHVYTLAEKQIVRNRSTATLALVRQGLEQQYLYMGPSFALEGAYTPSHMRSQARLLLLDAQVHQGRGEWGAAEQSDLDAIQLGETVPRGADLLVFLTGVAMEFFVRENAWDCIGHLNATEARTAAVRLARIQTQHVPPSEIIQQEKWNTLADLTTQIFPTPQWRDSLPTTPTGLPNPLSKREWIARYTRQMDSDIANARTPYRADIVNAPSDPLVVLGADLIPSYRFLDADLQTQNALLEIALALQAYHAAHGQYPQTLDQLTPSVVSKLPVDPFHNNQPFAYRTTPTGYLLYSVGPDGHDDGGTPLSYSHTSDNITDKRMAAHGDIVAGVNQN